MKAPTIVASLLLLAFHQGAVGSDSYEGDYLRLGLGFNISSTVLDDGLDEITILESGFGFGGAYQSAQGFSGGLRFSRITVDEIEINGRSFDVDERYTLREIGLGYRMPRASGDGLYWGVGFSNSKADEPGSDATNSLGVFWQKDRIDRFGSISVQLSKSDDFNLLSVSGTHVWFGSEGVGFGVTWGLGTGRTDTGFQNEADIGAATLGAIVMFRPKV